MLPDAHRGRGDPSAPSKLGRPTERNGVVFETLSPTAFRPASVAFIVGIDVSSRGRIPAEILDQYRSAGGA